MEMYKKTCRSCKTEVTFKVTNKQAEELRGYEISRYGNRHIQQIIPKISPAIREMFLTGLCGSCWDQIFARKEKG